MRTTHCPYCGQSHPDDAENCPVSGKPLTSSFLQIGKVVGGKYELLKLIGEGGIGFVYEARNVEIRNHVALKLVHGPLTASPEVKQRFIKEAIAAAEIGHENIVSVTDKGVDQATGALFIVMELLKGETLVEMIKREGTLSVPVAVDVILQVCSALKAAHEKGIVHRNMKPENIFLTKIAGRRNFVKILDFGVASIREPAEGKGLMETEAMMGTPHYMAPEQISGTGELDGRVDQYACGAILYEAMAGKVPFDANSFHAVVYKIMNEPPPGPRTINSRLTKDIEAIIMRALKKDPNERFRSIEELARALEPFGSGQIEFDRYTFLPPKQAGKAEAPAAAATGASASPQPRPAAQPAQKQKKGGLPGIAILLIVFLPVVSVIALVALVVINVFYFSKKDDKKIENPPPVVLPLGSDAASGADALVEDVAAEAGPEAVPEVEEEAIAKRKLEIVTDPPGAEISLNGTAIGKAPLEVETEEPTVNLEAKLDGYEVYTTTYEVKTESTTIAIKLTPVPKKKKKCDPRDPKCRVGGR